MVPKVEDQAGRKKGQRLNPCIGAVIYAKSLPAANSALGVRSFWKNVRLHCQPTQTTDAKQSSDISPFLNVSEIWFANALEED